MGVYRGVYLDEEIYEKTKEIARRLGYRSFNEFLNDLLKHFVVQYEVHLKLKELEEREKLKEGAARSILDRLLRRK